MKNNLYKTVRKFISNDFGIRKDSTADEILFIRRMKLFAIGASDRVPENMGDDLVEIDVNALANALGISRFKLRVKGDFYNKKRKNTVADDPTVISQVRNFFELPENSTQGDRVRNIVNVDGMNVHRQYLRKPIIIIARNFVEQFPIKYVSISTVQKIVRNRLKHLTIPTKRLVYKFKVISDNFKILVNLSVFTNQICEPCQ